LKAFSISDRPALSRPEWLFGPRAVPAKVIGPDQRQNARTWRTWGIEGPSQGPLRVGATNDDLDVGHNLETVTSERAAHPALFGKIPAESFR